MSVKVPQEGTEKHVVKLLSNYLKPISSSAILMTHYWIFLKILHKYFKFNNMDETNKYHSWFRRINTVYFTKIF